MRRFHSEVALMERRRKFAQHWYSPKGHLRKRKPLDCGRPRCGLCHGEKFFSPKARHTKKLAAIRYEQEA